LAASTQRIAAVRRLLSVIFVCAAVAACTKGGCKGKGADASRNADLAKLGDPKSADPKTAAPAQGAPAAAPAFSPPPPVRADLTIENDGPPPKPVAPIAFDALATVPADTPFLFVALDAPSEDVRTRFVWDLAPVVSRVRDAAAIRLSAGSGDAIDRLLYSALVEIPADLSPEAMRRIGFGPFPRWSAYGLDLVPVLRLESVDRAALEWTVSRVMRRAGLEKTRKPGDVPHWIVETADETLLVALPGGHLVVALGSPVEMRAAIPALLSGPGAPIDGAAVRRTAADHGLVTQGVGWVDLARVAALLEKSPDAGAWARRTDPRCVAEARTILATLPRVVLGIERISSARLVLAAVLELDPAVAAALQAERQAVPGVPTSFDPPPLVGFALHSPAAGTTAAWRERMIRLAQACGEDNTDLITGPPWDSVRGASLAIYDGTWTSILPENLQGWAALVTDAPEAVLDTVRKATPLDRLAPPDGGAFVPLPGVLDPVTRTASVARRGGSLIVALGGRGEELAKPILAPAGPSPYLVLFLDLARIVSRFKNAADDEESLVLEVGLRAEAGLDDALKRLASTITMIVEAGPRGPIARLDLGLAPKAPHPKPKPPDARKATIAQCRTLLARSWTAVSPSLARLGVTTQLDELEKTYKTSIEARSYMEDCLALDVEARRCLIAAPNPVEAGPRCAPTMDHFKSTAAETPPLFSFFGPRPLEDRLHPPIDGAPIVARLTGTWVAKDDRYDRRETWVVSPSGATVATVHDTWGGKAEVETDEFKIEITRAGELRKKDPDDQGWQITYYFMPEGDLIYIDPGLVAVPLTDESRFVVPLGSDGWLVREAAGCTAILESGLQVPATCTFSDESGTRVLRVTWNEPCGGAPDGCGKQERYHVIAGHLVDEGSLDERFVRQK
jgi:hypothetical protein